MRWVLFSEERELGGSSEELRPLSNPHADVATDATLGWAVGWTVRQFKTEAR
jgi:hypothetical protein